ncbi:MAG TPA: HXXEE domain-containing protein [Blastocatellia bacterium]|nr:HXXEE domain-containing protein [Blastocatellia bacterium]
MISKRTSFWMVPILTTLHNTEEVMFMPRLLQVRNSSIPGPLQRVLPPLTYEQFLLAVVIMTVIPYFVALYADFDRERAAGMYLILSLQAMMLINVFAHLGMAVIMHGYAPGVVTAVVINLPFSLYLLRRALRENWISRKAEALICLAGLALHAAVLPGIVLMCRGMLSHS